ncbi:LAGLIDADG family homing endonuclease, partial [Streptomyces sp. P17]
MRASRAERLELLRGLIDSDGWVESFNSIRFSSSSIDFAGDVQA